MSGAATTGLVLDATEIAAGAWVIGAPHEDADALRGAFDAKLFYFEENGLEGAFHGTQLSQQGGPLHTVVLYLPKGKRRLRYALQMIAAALEAQGRVLVVGAKNEGIKSARNVVREFFGQIDGLHHGGHAQLIVASSPNRSSDAFELERFAATWDTGLGFDAVSYPGTFAEGRLDDGSSALLQAIEWPKDGAVLDLACGSGVLGIECKRRSPGVQVLLADHDHLSVAASRATAGLAGVEVEVRPSDVYAAVPESFDLIVCNPPFHAGTKTDREVATWMIMGAPAHLENDGELVLVANRFLPYEDLLDASFDKAERLYEDGRFKVVRATGPKRRR